MQSSDIKSIAGTLEDSYLLDLSQRITNGDELEELGIKTLKLPEFIIKSALYNHSRSIQSAAHNVLSTWLKQQQGDRQMAYTTLHTELLECDAFRSMAAELEQWVMGTVKETQISPECKLIPCCFCSSIFCNILQLFNARRQLLPHQVNCVWQIQKFCRQVKQAAKSNKKYFR